MILLDSCGQPIDDPDEFQSAIRPFQEAERREMREGPCEDDCQLTAVMIEDAVRYEPGYFAAIDQMIQRYLCSGNLYPERLHNGPPGLPCGGILTNRKPAS